MKIKTTIFATLLLAFAGLSSCDNGRNCRCTTTYDDGSPDLVEVHQPFDKTTNPDCSVWEGTETTAGVTATTTCEPE
ncbi:MAG: hypothetical protein AAF570_13830 [Bacteroidota bacterium]